MCTVVVWFETRVWFRLFLIIPVVAGIAALKEHKNVTQVFHEMILTIRNQDMLWTFESPDTKIEESGDQGGCFSQ